MERVSTGCRPGGDANHGGAGGNVLQDDRIGADPRPLANRNRAQHLGARANHDIIFECRVAFAWRPCDAAECDAVVKRHIIADHGGLADHHTHAVVDEKAPPDGRARMYFDASEHPPHVRDKAPEQTHAMAPQPICQAKKPQRVKARITEKNLDARTHSRVAAKYTIHIFFNALEHNGTRRISMVCS